LVTFLFYAFSIVALASAVGVILHRNPVYSALMLILTLFSLAGLYVLLDAPFVAAVQIIVYAGAIMVLFLFVIMLLHFRGGPRVDRTAKIVRWSSLVLAGLLLLGFLVVLPKSGAVAGKGPIEFGANNGLGSTSYIGGQLFTNYLLLFEAASILLLAAIIGAVMIARRRPRT
jgi:NADH-quinone oxidoreductase subunit J